MAKFLTFLLLIISLRSSYAQSCYCTTTWHYNQTFGQACTANADCWACQPGAYNYSWQQAFCPSYQIQTCSPETQTQSLSCPSGYTGSITQTKTKTCTTSGQGIWSDWTTTSNTCVKICQTQTETRQQSCPTVYEGYITETRQKICPQETWTAWQQTQNTCVKSLTNPTNVTSPVSPVSPLNPTFNTSVTTTPSVPATATTQTSVQNSTTTTDGLSAQTQANSVTSTPAQTDAKVTSPLPNSANTSKTSLQQLIIPKGKTYTPVGLALSLEAFQVKTISQYNLFPTVNINQELPFHVKIHDQILMELLAVPLPTQDGLLKGMQNVIGIENE